METVIKTDKIKCPECGKVQDAEVTQHLNAPFATYIKNCDCGYTIMESEWDVVEWIKYNEPGIAAVWE